MRCFIWRSAFLLALQFAMLVGSADHDRNLRFSEVIEDLTHKAADGHQFGRGGARHGGDSAEYPDGYSVESDEELQNRKSSGFEAQIESLVRNDPDPREIHKARDRGHGEGAPDRGEEQEGSESAEQEEVFLLVKRSGSRKNHPLAESLERLVREEIGSLEHHGSHRHLPKRSRQKDDSTPSRRREDVCTEENFDSNADRKCSEGPEYEMQFPHNYSEFLNQTMEKMRDVLNANADKCDYRKRLGPNTGPEDRALCPFRWKIKRNPSRIPESLFEAQCFCQCSRKVYRKRHVHSGVHEKCRGTYECIPLKRVIPVLWIVACTDGKETYRQGWEEIAVACVPLEERESVEIPSKRIKKSADLLPQGNFENHRAGIVFENAYKVL